MIKTIISILISSLLITTITFAEDRDSNNIEAPILNEQNTINSLNSAEISKEEKKELIRKKIKEIIEKRKIEKEKKVQELIKKQKREIVRKKIKAIIEKKNLERIELNSAKEKSIHEKSFDISKNIKYKSIQEKSLSCELSATSDILSHLEAKKISESHVIDLVSKSYYNGLPIEEDGKKIWGNPNLGYVGYIDKLPDGTKAKQSEMTGYGVLEKPIAKIYAKYGYKTKIITKNDYNDSYSQKNHLYEVLSTISNGNMVQLWGDYCTDQNYEDTTIKNKCRYFNSNRKIEWYYKEKGELIKYEGLNGEHAFYLLGYVGTIQNPSHIIVWDTMTGRHIYPIKEWLRKWNMMENKSIIIYKK